MLRASYNTLNTLIKHLFLFLNCSQKAAFIKLYFCLRQRVATVMEK